MALDVITAPALNTVSHGFFGRRGGTSSGIFEGLNCGLGSSDQREIVATNRRLVAQFFELGPEALQTVYQHHSAKVATLTPGHSTQTIKADAMVSAETGLALGILTADCAPILFADAQAGVIGAAHSGWKGAVGGVIEATIAAMCALGANRGAISAAIGPTISQRNYEVGPDFLDHFDSDPENMAFFSGGQGDRMHFDLPGFCLHKLRQAGCASVEWTGQCTYADPARFYSYRRSTHLGEPDYGRLISVITQ